MTAPLPGDGADETGGGAPPWMVTYGDSITLLLTFFVMLLTFSTPNREGMAELAKGILTGSRRMALFAGPTDEENVVPGERMLNESRLDESGAETPPMAAEDPLDELTRHFESLDISKLKELQGGRVIRIPVVELFGTGAELTGEGARVLDNVVKVIRAKRHSVVVRVVAAVGATPQARQERSLRMSVVVTGYLRAGAGKACEDIGVSDNVELLGSAANPGTCEIVMLEV
jgi:flagellar motor protein MotB